MIEKELLWRAWPDGYLAIRGAGTIEGWQCIESGKNVTFLKGRTHISWRADDPPYQTHSVADMGRQMNWREIQTGDLLPNVDPTDAATWACLLRELAHAAFDEDWKGPITWLPTKVSAEDIEEILERAELPLFFTEKPEEARERVRALVGQTCWELAVYQGFDSPKKPSRKLEDPLPKRRRRGRSLGRLTADVRFFFRTDDPCEALARARIALREE